MSTSHWRGQATADTVVTPVSPAARRLYEAAVQLFFERGSLSTSVRDVTRACGLTQGALYNHYTSKEHLLYMIILDAHRTLEDEMLQAMGEAGPPVEQLRAVVTAFVLFHAAHPREAQIANLEFRHLSPDLTMEIVTVRRRLRAQMVTILQAGEAAGDFHLPPGGMVAMRIVAATILDMCIHITEWFQDRHPWSAARLATHSVDVALRIAGSTSGPPGAS